MVWLSVFFSLLYCVGDAVLNSEASSEGAFLSLLLSPQHANWLERSAVVLAIIASGVLGDALRQRRGAASRAGRERDRELAESLAFLEEIVNSIDDPFYVEDAQRRLVRVNKAYCALLGRTEEELLGKPGADLPPHRLGGGSAEQEDRASAALERTGKITVEEHVVDAGGAARILLVNKRLYQAGGGGRFVVGIARDVTDLKLMESLILSAKTEWEETFNTIDEAVTVHDADYTIVSANRAAQELFSLPLQSLLGQRCCRVYHGQESPPQLCSTCGVARTGKPLAVSFFEPHLGRHLEINAMPRRGGDGRITGVIHIVRDITERLRVEAEQRRLEEHLRQAQKIDSIGRLAGGIAHDFNNIVSAILGYSELALLKLPAESPLRATVTAIKESGERAAALTGQLLAFSRRQVLQVKPLDMNAVVTGVAKLLRRMIGEDVVLEVRTCPAAAVVRADRHQIEQILINLAVNSRDAMPDGGRLLIETGLASLQQQEVGALPGITAGDYVLVTVSDDGCGMSEAIRSRVFEPFFTTKAPGSGTGLGLATVYGIVKQHQGCIYLESAPGKGTTFRVYLPAARDAAPAATVGDTGPAPRGSGTVLVVDDDPALRRLVCETLSALGYTAFEADSAEAAARVVAGHPGGVDVLLTDVVMPGTNGRELARRLCDIDPGLRVIFMSGYADEVVSRHGVLEPGLNFLSKPFDQASLGGKIRDVLSGPPRPGPRG